MVNIVLFSGGCVLVWVGGWLGDLLVGCSTNPSNMLLKEMPTELFLARDVNYF